MSNTPLLQRLDRLEAYLLEDPQNQALLADAFDTALQAGALERAEFHLRHAVALGHGGSAWTLREAHWLLAQHRWEPARAVLLRLQGAASIDPALAIAVAHDLGYLALRTGNVQTGIAALQSPAGAQPADAPLAPALQALWLRLLHRAQQLPEAADWAQARWAAGQLAAEAAGVASLVALDLSDYAASLRLADYALQHDGICVEALVARGSTALAQRDSRLARQLLQQALASNADDGRTWSALGYCELLEQDLGAARTAFDKAVLSMPGHIGTWHGMGWASLMAQDHAGARLAFDRALALDRNFAESHGGMAVVLALSGEREAASQAIERARRLDQNSLSQRYAQAVLDGEARDIQALRRLAQRLLGGRQAPFGGSLANLVVPSVPGMPPTDRQDV